MSDEEILETVRQLKKLDNEFETHLVMLLKMAENLPNSYIIASKQLEMKTRKYLKDGK